MSPRFPSKLKYDSKAFKEAEYVIISTSANFDQEKNYFNTRTVEGVIQNILSINQDTVMVNKSKVLVEYKRK